MTGVGETLHELKPAQIPFVLDLFIFWSLSLSLSLSLPPLLCQFVYQIALQHSYASLCTSVSRRLMLCLSISRHSVLLTSNKQSTHLLSLLCCLYPFPHSKHFRTLMLPEAGS